jgi:hypothetical protein
MRSLPPRKKLTRLNPVERPCTELHHDGHAVTFTAVAARTGLSRTILYRNPPSAPSSKNTDPEPPPEAPSPTIATLHTALDALATRVRRHEEQLRRLQPSKG